MNSYYETFLRKDIFPEAQDKVDIICRIYDEDMSERHYISMVLEDYIQGANRYTTRRYLERNIIQKYARINQCNAYLDDEYLNKLERRD